MIKLDSFFTIGKTHQVCEDYVIHGEAPVPHIILGDGCSSSPNTDFGARLLTHTAKNMIEETMTKGLQHFIPEGIVFYITNMIKKTIPTLGLSSQNLDSTLIILCKNYDSDIVRLLMIGDGIIIRKRKDWDFPYISKISYLGEMPYYLSYLLNEERNKAYDKKAKELNSKGRIKRIDSFACLKDTPYQDLTVVDYHMEDLEYIIIASDGLDSFYSQETGKKILLELTLGYLTQMKSFKGEFLKRRVKRMLKDYEKQGIYHYDDISLGIMYNETEQVDKEELKEK